MRKLVVDPDGLALAITSTFVAFTAFCQAAAYSMHVDIWMRVMAGIAQSRECQPQLIGRS